MATWVKLKYEDNGKVQDHPGDYLMNLDHAIGFNYMSEEGIAKKYYRRILILFHGMSFEVTPKAQPQLYQQLLDYIQTTTGHSVP